MAFQDIRKKSRQFLSPTDVAFILGALIVVAALLALNIHLARTYQGGEWLFLRWSGARAFLFERIEPYGSTIAQRVQILAYGREAYLNEYPYALNDPFYLVLLYTPLALFSDFTIARAIWMLFSQAALIGIVALSLRLSELEPPRWMIVSLIGFGLFNYFSLQSLLSNSPTIFLTFLYLAILLALRSYSDEIAGTLLFLVAYQWEVGALFFLFVVIFAIANRRWGVFAGFGMALVVLFIVSFLVNPGWAVSYASAVLFDWSRGMDYTFGITLAYIFPNVVMPPDTWIAVLVGILLFVEALRAVNSPFRHVAWTAFLAMALNPMMGFAIFPTNHVVLLPAIVLVILLMRERWRNRRSVVSAVALIVIFVLSYGLYYQIINSPDRLYSDLMKILPPIFTLACLYWMRWWAVRPPRLWADQFGARK